jgi:hypothetical protein
MPDIPGKPTAPHAHGILETFRNVAFHRQLMQERAKVHTGGYRER